MSLRLCLDATNLEKKETEAAHSYVSGLMVDFDIGTDISLTT